MAGIPEPRKKHFYHTNSFAESVGFLAVVAGSCSAFALALPIAAYPADHRGYEVALAWIAITGSVGSFGNGLVKIIQARAKDRVEKEEAQLDGIKASLHLMHSLGRHKYGFPRDEANRLRVTFLLAVKAGKDSIESTKLKQVFDYVGGNGGSGREFSVSKGIAGKVFREGDPFVANRNNSEPDSYIKEMVRDWSYTENEARQLSFDRNSWMAVPILYRGITVNGVVYLDSNKIGFFTEDVQEQILWACKGLATFIDERY